MASNPGVMESVASLPQAVDPDSSVQPTLPPIAANHHVTEQHVDLLSIVQLVEGLDPFEY